MNLVENVEQNKNSILSNIIELFEKLQVNNKYYLCISGEAFRLITNKLKDIYKDNPKLKRKFNEGINLFIFTVKIHYKIISNLFNRLVKHIKLIYEYKI